MNKNNDIIEELNSIAPALVPLHKCHVFSVPDNYFQHFSTNLLLEIKKEISILPLPKNVMDIPHGYFDSLADNILAKIKLAQPVSVAQELKNLSPTLTATGNDNVFKVPPSYFQDLPEIILSQVNRPAKVVTMKIRSSFARYAAAAIVSGILGLSLFSLLDNKASTETTPLTASVLVDGKKILQTNSFDSVLETVSDDEIVGYLQNSGQDVNAALVASTLDSKELPAADDYILNDNTLKNFMDKLHINNNSN